MVLTRLSLILMFVTILIGPFSRSVGAEWKMFYQIDEGQKKYYFDEESIVRPNKSTVQVRYRVMDSKEEDNEVEISTTLVEITCKPKSYKIIEETKAVTDAKTDESAKEPVNVTILRHSFSFESVMGTLWTNLCP